ncbi:MAG: hypothetical protein AB1782_10890 [Cyanobacteriota bacterium]
MKALQTILQLIAAVLIISIPIIILYWVMTVIDIEPLSFVTDFLGMFITPFVNIVRGVTGDVSGEFKGFFIDWVPIYLAGVLLLISIGLTVIAKFINGLRTSINFVEAKTKVHIAQKQKQAEEKQEEARLFENTLGYVVVRHKTQTTSSSYLISSGLSDKDIKNMFMEQFNRYMYLDAQLFKESSEDNFMLNFEDVSSCITYSLQLQENMVNLNKELDKAGIKMHVTCGIYCTTPQHSKEQAFVIAGKICNLAGPGEVTCSKEVKEIYERDKADHNLKYISKGTYDLGHEIDIFAVQKLF